MQTILILNILVSILSNINCDNMPSIIIIGSGPAGISATATLLANNITNITVLEAEGRIGGRIHSVKFREAIVDLGAQWCHGQKDNIVFELANRYNLLEPDEMEETFYHSSRKEINPSVAQDIIKIVMDIYDEIDNAPNVSLEQYIIPRFNMEVMKKYGNDSKTTKLAGEIFNFSKKMILEMEGAFSLDDISAPSNYEVCDGPNLHWKGRGYKTILDVLLKNYPDSSQRLLFEDKLKLNKEVSKIIWDTANTKTLYHAAVECSDGSIYFADHIIFTPSLGVLKNRHMTLFEPKLSESKVNAIKDLGIAAVMKVLFYYSPKWWPERDEVDFTFVWDEEDAKHLFEDFPLGSSNKDGKHWLTSLIGLSSIPKNPNVLLAWFTGEPIPQLELLPEQILIDGVTFVLKKFLGHLYNITKPETILRTQWYSNPHFMGTYSFETVDSHQRNVSQNVVLSQPLFASNGHQTLLFAGEATHPTHYGTVHGAIETGQREAKRLIDIYKTKLGL